jgi:hypothetical protein
MRLAYSGTPSTDRPTVQTLNFDVCGTTYGRCAAVVQRALRGFGGDHQVDGDFAAVAATVLGNARK